VGVRTERKERGIRREYRENVPQSLLDVDATGDLTYLHALSCQQLNFYCMPMHFSDPKARQNCR
jgi:hypothetical protein